LLNMKNHDRHSTSTSPSNARPRAKAKTNGAKSTMRFTNGGNPWTSMPLEKLVCCHKSNISDVYMCLQLQLTSIRLSCLVV
jgi:hypothetical protein